MTHLPIGKSANLFRLGGRGPSRHPIRGRPRIGPVSDPIELWAPGAARPSIYVCRRCKTGYNMLLQGTDDERHAYARWQAARCCDARCERCQAPVQRFHSRCEACQRLHMAAQRRAWAPRAKPVPDDGGWVYSDDVQGYNDGYFDSLASLVEYIEENVSDGLTLPAWVHPCLAHTPSLDVTDMYEQMDENWEVEDQSPSEDIPDDLAKALEDVVEQINQKLTATCYNADFSRVIILDAERFNAEFGIDVHGRPITSWSDRPPTVPAIDVIRYWRRISEAQAEALQETAR